MHTVIVGGGFAGIKAALELSRAQMGRVTLISDRPIFVHHGALHQALTGGDPAATTVALEDIFASHPEVRVIEDKMTSLDPDRKLVVCGHNSYDYDQLILALGSEANYRVHSTGNTHVFGDTNLGQLTALHEHLHAALSADLPVDRRYAVIGGGVNGVEIAGLLAEYVEYLNSRHLVTRARVKIMLIEASDRILPQLSKQASHTALRALQKQGVEVLTRTPVSENSTEFVTAGHRKLPVDTVIWATGTHNNSFFKHHPEYFDVGSDGLVKVNPYLEAYRDIYVLGDNIAARRGGRIRAALDMAEYVVDHLIRRQTGRLQVAYNPSTNITSVPVGAHWAYVECFGVYVTGRLGKYFSDRVIRDSYRRILPATLVGAAVASHTTKMHDF